MSVRKRGCPGDSSGASDSEANNDRQAQCSLLLESLTTFVTVSAQLAEEVQKAMEELVPTPKSGCLVDGQYMKCKHTCPNNTLSSTSTRSVACMADGGEFDRANTKATSFEGCKVGEKTVDCGPTCPEAVKKASAIRSSSAGRQKSPCEKNAKLSHSASNFNPEAASTPRGSKTDVGSKSGASTPKGDKIPSGEATVVFEGNVEGDAVGDDNEASPRKSESKTSRKSSTVKIHISEEIKAPAGSKPGSTTVVSVGSGTSRKKSEGSMCPCTSSSICTGPDSVRGESAIGDMAHGSSGIDDFESCDESPYCDRTKVPCSPTAVCADLFVKGKKKNVVTPKESQQMFYLSQVKFTMQKMQKALGYMEEKIRLMERSFEDFNTKNKNGEVNPAALYREIMKPDTIPYVRPKTAPRSVKHSTSKDPSLSNIEKPSVVKEKSNTLTCGPHMCGVGACCCGNGHNPQRKSSLKNKSGGACGVCSPCERYTLLHAEPLDDAEWL